MDRINVAIVEDNAQFRGGLEMILNGSPGFQCVYACRTAEEAIHRIPGKRIDVVLMDINLPGKSGIDCVHGLRQLSPKLQIVMLTIEEDHQRVFASLKAGASGYLVKNLAPANILEAIQEVNRGGSPMSSQIARMVVDFFRQQVSKANAAEQLTAREREVLTLVSKGYRSKEAAQELGIGVQTVETHLRNIYDKMHVRSRAEAVAKLLQT